MGRLGGLELTRFWGLGSLGKENLALQILDAKTDRLMRGLSIRDLQHLEGDRGSIH